MSRVHIPIYRQQRVTTSPLPGTTLDAVAFPVLSRKKGGKKLTLFDLPGVLNTKQLSVHLMVKELKEW